MYSEVLVPKYLASVSKCKTPWGYRAVYVCRSPSSASFLNIDGSWKGEPFNPKINSWCWKNQTDLNPVDGWLTKRNGYWEFIPALEKEYVFSIFERMMQ